MKRHGDLGAPGRNDAVGWTNTHAKALEYARTQYERMLRDGFADIEFSDTGEECEDGYWRFLFRHTVTGVEILLETTGIDDMAAFLKQGNPDRHDYWGGCSVASPQLKDFAADGYRPVMTYRATPPEGNGGAL